MSSSKKNWPVQGLFGRCLSEFIPGGLHRDAVYRGWPIAHSYIIPNAGGKGELRGLRQWVQLYTGAQKNSIFNLWFIPWRYSQLCWYFRPSFVNNCPCNLLSSWTLPTPLPCVNKYTVYPYTVCRGVGLRYSGPQTNTRRKAPLQVNFLDDDIFGDSYCL